MNHFIEVKEIEISDIGKAVLSESYPKSGFWLVKVKNIGHLRFVDKEENITTPICGEHIYKSMGIDFPVLPKQEEITNMSTFYNVAPGYVSEMFVLDFAKLLLSKKQ
ncbi:hypothetical protein [Chryseobacterium sp. WLY505]|uniref:hypothetical protein n=1 Tax=Chryseobacterium sp. WLY505 TaxID=3068892 RepID=UPI00279667FA|nr:hypothetical protein [Chryseobacterium sp. WLY505]MDQ1855744.1 hypothetical protein [Chryseobacterium sp. WLY505]